MANFFSSPARAAMPEPSWNYPTRSTPTPRAKISPHVPLNNAPLTDGLSAPGPLSPKKRAWQAKLQKMDFSKPDHINENIFNRYIWYSIKGDARYPSEYVGAHGKGLKKLGLVLDPNQKDADD